MAYSYQKRKLLYIQKKLKASCKSYGRKPHHWIYGFNEHWNWNPFTCMHAFIHSVLLHLINQPTGVTKPLNPVPGAEGHTAWRPELGSVLLRGFQGRSTGKGYTIERLCLHGASQEAGGARSRGALDRGTVAMPDP